MNKIATLIVIGILLNTGAKAQKVLFGQDFNSFPGYNITGWTHQFTGAVPWLAGEPYLVGECIGPLMAPTGTVTTNKVAAVVDCSALADYNNISDLMFTRPISLIGDTGVWLKYDSYFGKYVSGSYTERATVEVSTDTGKTWTIVQDVPRNPSPDSFHTYYISLSAYNNAPAVWIGFRYSDGGGYMRGWAIDNVEVFVPAQNDIALISVTPTDTMQGYVTINTGYTHQAVVMNEGNDTITYFFLNYRQDGSGPIYSALVTGVSIPRFGTYEFAHHIPDTVLTQGKHNVAIWAALIGDSIHNNDSANVVLHGAFFEPAKKTLIEEGTSTQNGYCPKDWVLMNNTPTDLEACKVSVHFGDTDGMELSYYDDYLYLLHYPNNEYIYVDRKRILPDNLNNILEYRKTYFGFADLLLDPQINGDSLTMNVTVKPAIDMSGDYRLAMAITEDNVTGTDTTFAQRNFYSGGAKGPMGGFESKPNPVPAADMHYNFVARTINPSPGGDSAIIPQTLLHTNTYSYSIGAHISSGWKNNMLRAIVMLIRNDDTTVLNSNETRWYLGVKNTERTSIEAGVYPNPAKDQTTLFFNLSKTERVKMFITDMTGRTLFDNEAIYNSGENRVIVPLNNFTPGLYFISLTTDDGRKTLKLDVLK